MQATSIYWTHCPLLAKVHQWIYDVEVHISIKNESFKFLWIIERSTEYLCFKSDDYCVELMEL